MNQRIRFRVMAAFAATGLLILFAVAAQAQTFHVLHSFTGGADGADPNGLTADRNGNLYGTTAGSNPGHGIVYRFSHVGSGWVLTPLYRFQAGSDGGAPHATVTVAADGSLYGTTVDGGGGPCNWNGFVGCGTVFQLTPPPHVCRTANCPWTEHVLYAFRGAAGDLQFPFAEVTFDQSGALYGTATDWGSIQNGGVYKLAPSQGGWTYSVVHNLSGGDGSLPWGAVAFDQAGNLYGTASFGGSSGNGTVFKLSPSGSGWSETALYSFEGRPSSSEPFSGVILDSAGNLYGTTSNGGPTGGGSVFELSPAGGGFSYSTLYDGFAGYDGVGPQAKLVMDQAGNLYGTQYAGATNDGLVFKLTPTQDGWMFTDLHDFNYTDGQFPSGNLVLDSNGNLYGTTQSGGTSGNGVLWEITP